MIQPNYAVRLAGVLTAGLLCLASVLPAAAQTAHEHQHAGAAVANLHLVIADLLQGVSLMRGKDPARMPDQSLSKT